MESCRACRGEGKVISNLGGSPSEVECPWCEGTGKYIAEHDAQAHWGPREEKPPEEKPPEAPAGEGESGEETPEKPMDA